jgi:hypothetical protein
MIKKVKFYKWVILDSKDYALTYKDTTKIIKQIIKKHSVENSILLKEKNAAKKDEKNIYLDIIKDDNEFLFGKVGRSKFRYDMQKRNEKSKQTEDVLNDKEKDEYSVELTSYFLYNYKTEIILFISTSGAGTINDLNQLILKYTSKYVPNITAIVNKDILEQILNCEYLQKIEMAIAAPNTEFLTPDNIHIKDKAAIALQKSKIAEISMVIKPERGKNLEVGQNAKVILKGMVDLARGEYDVTPSQRKIKKLKVTSKDRNQKRYYGADLYEDDYILDYEFDLENIHEKTIYFKEIYDCLKEAYNDNIETIKSYI